MTRRRDRGAAVPFFVRLGRFAELESAALLAALGILCLASAARQAGLFGATADAEDRAEAPPPPADASGEAMALDPGALAMGRRASRAVAGVFAPAGEEAAARARTWTSPLRAGVAEALRSVSLPAPRAAITAGRLRLWSAARRSEEASASRPIFAPRPAAAASRPVSEALTPILVGAEWRRRAGAAAAASGEAGSWERLRADAQAQGDDLAAGTAAALSLAAAARRRLADGRDGRLARQASLDQLRSAADEQGEALDRGPTGVRFQASARERADESPPSPALEGAFASGWAPGASAALRWDDAGASLAGEVADRLAPRSMMAAFPRFLSRSGPPAARAEPEGETSSRGPGADCRALAALNAPPPPGAAAADRARTARGIALCKADLALALHDVLEQGPPALPDYQACLASCAR